MDLNSWRKLKRSGAYRRKVKKRLNAMTSSNAFSSATTSSWVDVKNNDAEGSVDFFSEKSDYNAFDEDFLKARTLFKCNTVAIKIIEMDNGQYWHNGLIGQLTKYLQCQSDIPNKISLNINIDGLPIYKSSNKQFWPILCNVSEMKEMSPLVIGIYEGKSKPLNLDTYLQAFIKELKQLETGLKIIDKTGVEKGIEVNIRAFICDSPARALIKGKSYLQVLFENMYTVTLYTGDS